MMNVKSLAKMMFVFEKESKLKYINIYNIQSIDTYIKDLKKNI